MEENNALYVRCWSTMGVHRTRVWWVKHSNKGGVYGMYSLEM